MAKFLSSLTNAVITGFVLAILMIVLYQGLDGQFGHNFGAFVMRWLHVLSGVMWIGLLWYFNFVQIPNMPNIPAEQKPAITGVIAPSALFWFRWSAMATIITGLLLAWMNGYFVSTLSLGGILLGNGVEVEKDLALGIGMWFGIIMFLNVWLVIWPNQKIALGIGGMDSPPEVRAAAGAKAAMFSRINTVLSIPMLFSMVAAQNIY
jgi:uncharacterized membrane protein